MSDAIEDTTHDTKPRIPKWAKILMALIPALLIGAHGGYWYLVTGQSLVQIENWADQQRAQGLEISYGEPVIEGYPFQARIILPNVSAVRDDYNFKVSSFVAEADIWSLHKVSLVANGQPQLTGINLSMVSGPWQGNIIFLEGRAAYIDFRTTNITIDRTGKPPVIASFLKVNVLEPRSSVPKGGVAPVVDLGIHIKDLTSPGGKPLPLGKEIKVLTLEGTLYGKPPANFNGGKTSEFLDAWQKVGGVFEVGNLNVEHGPLNLSAVGDVSLDHQLQPIGAFNARVQGFDETVSALSQKKIIGASEAMMAKLVLGALAEKPVEGQRASIKFPLSIQDQTLTAGPMKVMKLPKIIWD